MARSPLVSGNSMAEAQQLLLGVAELYGEPAHQGAAHLGDLQEKFLEEGPVDKADAAVLQRLAGTPN